MPDTAGQSDLQRVSLEGYILFSPASPRRKRTVVGFNRGGGAEGETYVHAARTQPVSGAVRFRRVLTYTDVVVTTLTEPLRI